jgi:hypothetical protein
MNLELIDLFLLGVVLILFVCVIREYQTPCIENFDLNLDATFEQLNNAQTNLRNHIQYLKNQNSDLQMKLNTCEAAQKAATPNEPTQSAEQASSQTPPIPDRTLQHTDTAQSDGFDCKDPDIIYATESELARRMQQQYPRIEHEDLEFKLDIQPIQGSVCSVSYNITGKRIKSVQGTAQFNYIKEYNRWRVLVPESDESEN